jgi:hypothetical protein
MAKQVKGYTMIMQRRIPYCIEFDDCYSLVKVGYGWAIEKDGERIEKYYYSTKYAAASCIPGRKYIETPSLTKK